MALHVELFPLHSPLLGESLLVSFPLLTNMLKPSRSSYLTSDQFIELASATSSFSHSTSDIKHQLRHSTNTYGMFKVMMFRCRSKVTHITHSRTLTPKRQCSRMCLIGSAHWSRHAVVSGGAAIEITAAPTLRHTCISTSASSEKTTLKEACCLCRQRNLRSKI